MTYESEDALEEYAKNGRPDNSEAESKFRWLEITICNVSVDSSKYRLEFKEAEMISGQVWNTPFQEIKPGKCLSFHVCTSSLLAGCTGGASWLVRHKDGRPGGYLVLTFSNPAVGNIKAKVQHVFKYAVGKDEILEQITL